MNNPSDELTSTPSATYTHDNKGNTLTKSGGSTNGRDFENRMISAVVPAGRGDGDLHVRSVLAADPEKRAERDGELPLWWIKSYRRGGQWRECACQVHPNGQESIILLPSFALER